MFGIPQSRQISHDTLVKHLELYGYHISSKKNGLWKHNSRPINFTLLVDDFGVKYVGGKHALHLKAALEYKYKLTINWEGNLYIGIALKWDYEKGTVDLSMPGYVCAALHSIHHKKPKTTAGLTITLSTTHIWKTIRCYQKKCQLRNWMKIIRKYFRKL